jgi:hypothetical protein
MCVCLGKTVKNGVLTAQYTVVKRLLVILHRKIQKCSVQQSREFCVCSAPQDITTEQYSWYLLLSQDLHNNRTDQPAVYTKQNQSTF